VERRILGTWSWVDAFGGIAGTHITPASTGVQREIRFLDGGYAELWENGQLVRTATYEFGVGDPEESFAGREIVRWNVTLLGGWEEQAVAFPQPATLILTDPCCDGYEWTFVRASP
jgi:hypothetical protein